MSLLQLLPISLGLLLVLPLLLLRRSGTDPARQALRSLACERDVAALTPPGVGATARRLRTGLPERPLPQDLGVLLGRLEPRGPELRASWEDVVLAVMAPRAGKTTSLVVPAVLDAPGPVVMTSNKADGWAATAVLRASRGRPWLFDPQTIATGEQTWWWDPLEHVTTVAAAERLAGMFVAGVEDERSRDVWGPSAREYLAGLFLAARASGRTLLDTYAWLVDEQDPQPVRALRAAGLHPVADSLAGIQASPPETRGSVLFTARVAVRALRDPAITRWTTPPEAPLDRFDPAAFVESTDALYLLSKDSGASAAPFVAALTDAVLQAAVRAAERHGGRLPVPLVAALDEAANVVRIGDLPQLYSHLGARGIVPLTILQSYAQAVAVWGDSGAKTLWSAATVKLLGPGIDDAGFARDVSELVGDHDIPTTTRTSGNGRRSTSTSTRRDRILSPAQLRALPKGRALVLATGTRPALVRLLPYYTGPRAAEIAQASQAAADRIAGAARGGAA